MLGEEKTAAALGQSRATALNGLVVTPWGHRNLRVEDPDGMQVTLFEVSSKPALDDNNQ